MRAYEEEPRLAEERQSQLTEVTGQSRSQVRSEEGLRPSRRIRQDVRNAVLALGIPFYLGRKIWHRERLRAEERRLAEEQRLAEEAERQRQEKIRLHEEAERRRRVIDTLRRAKERSLLRRRRPEDEEQRKHIESLLRRDALRDDINYMSGAQFERFVADVLRQKGYAVEETKATGDQGVDLLIPNLDGKRVAVQLKRYTGPVGNAAVQATFAGMGYYQAEEGWVITTSTFTRSARELARSLGVRLIDGKELADWLEGLNEE